MRMNALFIGVMLLLSVLVLNARAQEPGRVGLNTTLRSFGEDIKSMQELGVHTIRVPLEWQLVKISPGEYDWSGIDRFVKTARANQIEVLFTIRTTFREKTPKIKQKKGSIQVPHLINPPSVDMKEWVYFVETLANRYRGQGVNYEIENEGNFWKGTQEEYLEMLKRGYDVIKKVDPKAEVLPCTVACMSTSSFQSESARQEAWRWHDKWLQPIFSTKKFDVVNVHDYYFPSDIVANGLTFRGYLEHIQNLMKGSGLGDRPIWITEIGYVGIESPDQQAKWSKEAFEQAFEFGVKRIYWRLLRDGKEPYFGSMGLADAKGNPRPVWNTLKQFAQGVERKDK